jgi:hypothetical protein
MLAQRFEIVERFDRGSAHQWREECEHIPMLGLTGIFQSLTGVIDEGVAVLFHSLYSLTN